ncbi:MAG: NADH-quinone oxidoreductase subunit NuoH [Thermoprotei archaeon]
MELEQAFSIFGVLRAISSEPVLVALLVAIAAFIIVSVGALVELYIERKFWARIMSRYGPTEVGRYGTLQLFADAIKFVFKEDFTPGAADAVIYNLVPILVIASSFGVFVSIPFDYTVSRLFPPSANPGNFVISNFDPSLLIAYAFFALGPILVLFGGWAAASKYTLIGGFRSAAQLISYEIPLVFSILSVAALTRTFDLFNIISSQAHSFPFVFLDFPAFIVFLIALLAELERTPFDMTEADSELIAGWNTEYGGTKFLLVYLSEYMRAFGGSAILVALFFGGWLGPAPVPALVWFFIKTVIVFTVLVWIRAAYPRVRIDQMMGFGWKILVPVSVLWLILTPIVATAAAAHGLLVPAV